MGGIQSSCRRIGNLVKTNQPVLSVRVSGRNGSGKNSVINYIKHGKSTVPEEENSESETSWILYDTHKLMLWTSDYDVTKVDDEEEEHDSKAVIYVIDGTDKINFSNVKRDIQRELEYSRINTELLIMINKCDDPTCASVSELHMLLDLDAVKDRHVQIMHTSALTGQGISEGLDWLCGRFDIKKGEYVVRTGMGCQTHNIQTRCKEETHHNGCYETR